jgi:hypothetical protein
MADDLKHRGTPDPQRINVHERWEVEYWTKKFGCTSAELVKAVSAVGVSAAAVEQWLRKNK